MTGSSDNGLSSAIPEAPDTETGIISGALRPLAQGFKRNVVKFTVLFTGKVACAPCGNVMLFLIKRPSHPGHCLLSTEGSYTNTGMLMA